MVGGWWTKHRSFLYLALVHLCTLFSLFIVLHFRPVRPQPISLRFNDVGSAVQIRS